MVHDDAELDNTTNGEMPGSNRPEQGNRAMQGDESEYLRQEAEGQGITVFQLMGSPMVRAVADIPDSEMEQELDKLIGIMSRHNVAVDTVCDVEERELYRFITEELFFEPAGILTEDDDLKRLFIYEEFHPNHEYDIINHTLDFVTSLFDEEKDLMPEFLGLSEQVNTSGGGVMPFAEVVRQLEMFRNAFVGFDVCEFGPVSVSISGHSAVASFTLQYTGFIEGGDDTVTFKGLGKLGFIDESGYWSICSIQLPGITL